MIFGLDLSTMLTHNQVAQSEASTTNLANFAKPVIPHCKFFWALSYKIQIVRYKLKFTTHYFEISYLFLKSTVWLIKINWNKMIKTLIFIHVYMCMEKTLWHLPFCIAQIKIEMMPAPSAGIIAAHSCVHAARGGRGLPVWGLWPNGSMVTSCFKGLVQECHAH